MAGRSVFVTGAYGLLGSWLVKDLEAQGARVTVLKRDDTVTSALTLEGTERRVNVVRGDVADLALVERALTEYEVDTVFHLAAQSIVGIANRSPLSTFETNIRGTWIMLEACRRVGVQAVIVAASDKAYGGHEDLPYREQHALQPRYPYEVSKAAADMIARSYWHTYGLPVAVTRLANLYGGGDLNLSRLVPGGSAGRHRRPAAGHPLRRHAPAGLPLRRGRRPRLPGNLPARPRGPKRRRGVQRRRRAPLLGAGGGGDDVPGRGRGPDSAGPWRRDTAR